MKFLAFFFSLMFFSFSSFAADHEGEIHTADFCTAANTCAHARFESFPTTSAMSEFIIHVLPATSTSTIQNLTAKLWMDMGQGHGHGSAPLDITTTTEANHFFATNAWFVMTGPWEIIINFQENGVVQEITIPLEIKE
jgi:hypothetical protein